jgi:asparagine synthetase B (glutamine-hydrolysing)
MAFYFAARGEGNQVDDDEERTPYKTPAKVFFSGLGADEQLGYESYMISTNTRGYSRHAAAWKRSNGDWNSIINEVFLR